MRGRLQPALEVGRPDAEHPLGWPLPRVDDDGNRQSDRLSLPNDDEWWIAVEGDKAYPKAINPKIFSRCVMGADGIPRPQALTDSQLAALRRLTRDALSLLLARARGREVVFWQSARTTKQARPAVSLPTARAAGQVLEILVDSHERYAWKFDQQQATTTRRALPAGDYAVAFDGEVIAVVERKSLADLVSTLTTGKLRNLGTPEEPTFLASELPRKPGHPSTRLRLARPFTTSTSSRVQVARAVVSGD